MFSDTQITNLESQRKYFIETNRREASNWEWMLSKGTNFSCYEEYMNSLNKEDLINNRLEIIRVIVYSLHRPFQFLFFYWTLLIFILHKFNFKKPVMKIILAHFFLRAAGDIVDKLGDLFPRYYSTSIKIDIHTNTTIYGCSINSSDPERHPFRWVLTRNVGIVLWYLGEIIADWYPLLRTKAVVKNKSIWVVYATCILFNISKIAIIVCHFCLSPSDLYDENGVYRKYHVNMFYFHYWTIHLIIIYCSVIYDFTVYRVLKVNVFNISNNTEIGFLKKFRTISEYRIYISMIISIVFLPLFSITIFIKFYLYRAKGYDDLDFSFDEVRQTIVNVQYYMIFIDQIFLIFSKEKCSSSSFSNMNMNDTSFSKFNTSTKPNSLNNNSMKSISTYHYINLNDKSNNRSNNTNSIMFINTSDIIDSNNVEDDSPHSKESHPEKFEKTHHHTVSNINNNMYQKNLSITTPTTPTNYNFNNYHGGNGNGNGNGSGNGNGNGNGSGNGNGGNANTVTNSNPNFGNREVSSKYNPRRNQNITDINNNNNIFNNLYQNNTLYNNFYGNEDKNPMTGIDTALTKTNKSKCIANYDTYDGYNAEWNYLK